MGDRQSFVSIQDVRIEGAKMTRSIPRNCAKRGQLILNLNYSPILPRVSILHPLSATVSSHAHFRRRLHFPPVSGNPAWMWPCTSPFYVGPSHCLVARSTASVSASTNLMHCSVSQDEENFFTQWNTRSLFINYNLTLSYD
jgi:hypothetical protein